MPETHLVIFEPVASGHQMDHLRSLLMVIETSHPTWRVTLLTSAEAAEHPSLRKVAADFAARLRVVIGAEAPPNRLWRRLLGPYYDRQRRIAGILTNGLAAIGPAGIDFVLIQQTETIGLWQLALRPRLCRGLPWGTLSVGLRFHHHQVGLTPSRSWSDLLQRALFTLALANPSLAFFASVNPTLAQAVRSPKLVICPDPAFLAPPLLGPAESRVETRRHYGLRPNSFVVLLYGMIAQRKAVRLLLEAAARVAPEIDLTILLAGRQHSNVAALLQSPTANTLRAQGRLVEANRFILDDADPEPLYAADLSWVLYETHFVHTSGVLVRSGMAGVAAICQATGLIGRLAAETGCGLPIPDPTPETVAAALEYLARDPAARAAMGASGRAAFGGHTPEAFATPLVEAIAR